MFSRKPIIGVMGPGNEAPNPVILLAYQLGRQIATHGWILLTGGRNAGVMEAASRGAKEAGGLTVGILPGSTDAHASVYVDIPILTGMEQARNAINTLSSRVVVACGMGLGTAAEVALAIKAKRPVILLGQQEASTVFWKDMGGALVVSTQSVTEAIDAIIGILGETEELRTTENEIVL